MSVDIDYFREMWERKDVLLSSVWTTVEEHDLIPGTDLVQIGCYCVKWIGVRLGTVEFRTSSGMPGLMLMRLDGTMNRGELNIPFAHRRPNRLKLEARCVDLGVEAKVSVFGVDCGIHRPTNLIEAIASLTEESA